MSLFSFSRSWAVAQNGAIFLSASNLQRRRTCSCHSSPRLQPLGSFPVAPRFQAPPLPPLGFLPPPVVGAPSPQHPVSRPPSLG